MRDPRNNYQLTNALKAGKAVRLKTSAALAFSLGERAESVAIEYGSLVDATIEAEATRNVYFSCTEDPASAAFFIEELSRWVVEKSYIASPRFVDLAGRWWRYSRSYRELVERSPLMELSEYLGQLSEGHAQMSWSDDVDLLIPWIDTGGHGKPPIDDPRGVLTRRVVDRLGAIRRATGGWLYEYRWGTFFLHDSQARLVPRGDDAQGYLINARETRASFEGL